MWKARKVIFGPKKYNFSQVHVVHFFGSFKVQFRFLDPKKSKIDLDSKIQGMFFWATLVSIYEYVLFRAYLKVERCILLLFQFFFAKTAQCSDIN